MTVPHRLFFSAQLSNCNLATCRHIELSILGLLIQRSFEQKLQLFYQVLSIENNPWAGLGGILLLAETQKNSDAYNSTKACFRGKALLGKPATITFGENKDVNSWIKLRLTVDFTTILLRQPSEELVPWEQTPEHNGIDSNMLDSGHHDCSKKAVFLCTAVKLQSWAFSTFHTSFI